MKKKYFLLTMLAIGFLLCSHCVSLAAQLESKPQVSKPETGKPIIFADKELTRQEMLDSAAERIKILEEKSRAGADERPSQTTPLVQEQTKPPIAETSKPETRGAVASEDREPTRQEIIGLAAERIKILEERQRDEAQANAALLKAAQPQPATPANAPKKNIEQSSKQPSKPAPAPEPFERPTIVQPEHDALIREYIELYYRRF